MKSKVLHAALLAASVLAAGALAPSAASASGLKVGEWSVGGIQHICLVADGTWYSTTFSTWSGHWELVGLGDDKSIVYGNYTVGSPGVGNDSFVVGKGNLSDWTEWHDFTVKVGFLDDTLWTFISKKCGPPAVVSAQTVRHNPMI